MYLLLRRGWKRPISLNFYLRNAAAKSRDTSLGNPLRSRHILTWLVGSRRCKGRGLPPSAPESLAQRRPSCNEASRGLGAPGEVRRPAEDRAQKREAAVQPFIIRDSGPHR